MKHIFTCIIVSLLAFVPATILAQSAPITLDGVFDDWTSNLATVTDPPEAVAGVDLLEIQVSNDEQFLYIRIKTNIEIDLVENTVPQTIRLSLDTDNNANTGYVVQDGFGSELTIVFKGHYAHYNMSPYARVNFTDIALRVSPTITADEFEIAIKRDAIPDSLNPLFSTSPIKILLHNGSNDDKLPNVGTDFLYTFDETPVPEFVPTDLPKEHPNHIRIVAYNTKGNGLNDSIKLPHFENIVTVLNPDIIGFSECGNTSPAYVKELMDKWLPLATDSGWFTGQRNNEDLITASRWPIVEQWHHLPSQYPAVIDLPAEFGTDLLFTNAHLKWGKNDDIRQEEVDAYIEFLMDAKSPGGLITLPDRTPFVYGGDLNFVGLAQQLRTLLTGAIQDTSSYGKGGAPDWDDTDVSNFTGLQSDIRMDYTWRNDGRTYAPGKLDYIIFSDDVMTAEKSFILQTEVMSAARLQEYGLTQLSTKIASDHFPIVTDFSLKTVSGITDETALTHTIYPNPASTEVHVSFAKSGRYQLSIYDLYGRRIFTDETSSNHSTIDIKNLPTGIYRITIGGEDKTKEVHTLIKR